MEQAPSGLLDVICIQCNKPITTRANKDNIVICQHCGRQYDLEQTLKLCYTTAEKFYNYFMNRKEQ